MQGILAIGKSIRQFKNISNKPVFMQAQRYPQFFDKHLVHPSRRIKAFLNDPNANIRAFYFQYLMLCFEIENQNYQFYISKIQKFILDPNFNFLFLEEDDENIFNDQQFKRFLIQFMEILDSGQFQTTQGALTAYPIADIVFVYFFRSLAIYASITNDFDSYIDKSLLYSFLLQNFNIDAQMYQQKCIKFVQAQVFVYEETPEQVYLVYKQIQNSMSSSAHSRYSQSQQRNRQKKMIGSQSLTQSKKQDNNECEEVQQNISMLEQDNNEQDVSCNNGANGSVSNINLNSCELERSGDGGIKNRILNVDNGNGGGEGSVAVQTGFKKNKNNQIQQNHNNSNIVNNNVRVNGLKQLQNQASIISHNQQVQQSYHSKIEQIQESFKRSQNNSQLVLDSQTILISQNKYGEREDKSEETNKKNAIEPLDTHIMKKKPTTPQLQRQQHSHAHNQQPNIHNHNQYQMARAPKTNSQYGIVADHYSILHSNINQNNGNNNNSIGSSDYNTGNAYNNNNNKNKNSSFGSLGSYSKEKQTQIGSEQNNHLSIVQQDTNYQLLYGYKPRLSTYNNNNYNTSYNNNNKNSYNGNQLDQYGFMNRQRSSISSPDPLSYQKHNTGSNRHIGTMNLAAQIKNKVSQLNSKFNHVNANGSAGNTGYMYDGSYGNSNNNSSSHININHSSSKNITNGNSSVNNDYKYKYNPNSYQSYHQPSTITTSIYNNSKNTPINNYNQYMSPGYDDSKYNNKQYSSIGYVPTRDIANQLTQPQYTGYRQGQRSETTRLSEKSQHQQTKTKVTGNSSSRQSLSLNQGFNSPRDLTKITQQSYSYSYSNAYLSPPTQTNNKNNNGSLLSNLDGLLMLDGRTGGDVSKSIFVQGSSAGKIDSVSKIDSSCHINGNNGRSINSYFNKQIESEIELALSPYKNHASPTIPQIHAYDSPHIPWQPSGITTPKNPNNWMSPTVPATPTPNQNNISRDLRQESHTIKQKFKEIVMGRLSVSKQFTDSLTLVKLGEPYSSSIKKMKARSREFRQSIISCWK